MRRRPIRRGQAALAGGLAIGAHLVVLLALGWRTPKFELRESVDGLPPIELSLVRIRPEAPAASAPAAGPAKPAPPAPATQAAIVARTPAPPAPSAPPAALAAATADCEPEDLPLLTAAERALCRTQIQVEKDRRLTRGADARAAKQVAEAKAGPQLDNIPAEKRAAYDAAVQAAAQPKPPMMHGSGGSVGVDCQHVTFPLLSGVEINPNLFRKKHKQERPSHSDMTCSAYIGG